MVYDRAHSWHTTTGIELEELISEAKLIMVKKLPIWNPNKSSFSNYLYLTLNNGLRDYCKLRRAQFINSSEDEIECFYSPSDFNWREGLTSDGICMVRELFNVLEEPGQPLNRQQLRNALRKRLKSQGWESQEIEETWIELQEIYG